MINKLKYRQTCSRFFQYMKKGRGGVYLGDSTLLGGNVIGQQILTEAKHAASIKSFFTPAPIESSIMALLFHLIKGGMVCADIGAGCGYHSVFLAALTGPYGKIYSFEGIPECYDLLVKNTLLNELHTIECINLFLAEKAKRIERSYFETHFQFFFSPSTSIPAKKLRAQTSSLDLFFEQKMEVNIDFIKIGNDIDILDVWRGMPITLTLSPEIKILCSLKSECHQLLDEIEKSGFKSYLLPTLKEVGKDFLLAQSTPKTLLLSRSDI